MNRGTAITSLLERWRQAADTLRRHGAAQLADAKEADCRELEAALVQDDLETLSIREAVSESGYSASQIRRMFPGQQRVARGALPRKPHLQAS